MCVTSDAVSESCNSGNPRDAHMTCFDSRHLSFHRPPAARTVLTSPTSIVLPQPFALERSLFCACGCGERENESCRLLRSPYTAAQTDSPLRDLARPEYGTVPPRTRPPLASHTHIHPRLVLQSTATSTPCSQTPRGKQTRLSGQRAACQLPLPSHFLSSCPPTPRSSNPPPRPPQPPHPRPPPHNSITLTTSL